MRRPFSVIRRRPNLVDLVIPVQPGVEGYLVDVALNFDAVYATIITSPLWGQVDPNLRSQVHVPVSGRVCRVIFDPANYMPPLTADNVPFWMRVTPIVGGAPGTPSAGSLVLPDVDHRYRGLVIAGNAPAAVSLAGSLEIDFPCMVEDMRIRNLDAAHPLFVATEDGGPEFQVLYAEEQLTQLRSATPFILVRGGGGAVAFTASFTSAFPR